ncbi:MAG TPA: signal peptidase II [Solirubrobacteraceae bacterium]
MRTRAWIRAGLVLFAVLAVDQLSKHAVEHSIVPGEEHKVLPGLGLVNTRNHGVAFGFLPGHQDVVTGLIALALLALVVYFAIHATQRLIWLPTGMLIGGALGNIVDRMREGSVTDFIKLPLGWPPFNLADMSITLGVLTLILLVDARRSQERRGAEHLEGTAVSKQSP